MLCYKQACNLTPGFLYRNVLSMFLRKVMPLFLIPTLELFVNATTFLKSSIARYVLVVRRVVSSIQAKSIAFVDGSVLPNLFAGYI